MMKRRLLAQIVLFGLLTSGCATNALRVEYAANVGAEGQAAGQAARSFANHTAAAQRLANIDLVVADPACGVLTPRIRTPPNLDPAGPATGWLCLAEGEQAAASTFAVLELDDPRRTLTPLFAAVNSLVAYTDVLAEIAGEGPPDVAGGIADALGTASAFEGAILALLGAPPDKAVVPASDDARVAAVAGFAQMLADLSTEQAQVDALRAVIAKHPEGASALITQLRGRLRLLETSRSANAAIVSALNTAQVQKALRKSPPLSAADRRAALEAFYAREAETDMKSALYPAVLNLVATLEQSDKDFRRVIVKDPDLTEKERRILAEITRKRVVRALQNFTSLINSFRGA
jgi:hypothetical protein